jgi:hypothetical protein
MRLRMKAVRSPFRLLRRHPFAFCSGLLVWRLRNRVATEGPGAPPRRGRGTQRRASVGSSSEARGNAPGPESQYDLFLDPTVDFPTL